MLRINTLDENGRMSTRDLLLAISSAVAAGEHDFYINASGQHDIGGPLWSPDHAPLFFEVVNPGQRVGGMCLPGTRVLVNGSTPADAGWLNSGGEVIIRGDSGDTTGHCAAAGKIYVGGRSGTRTGALMKHDPECEPPELWILKNTGSFSFEFMGGGKVVVCGHDCMALPSVLGERPCVGMVDGTVYFRGKCPELPPEARLCELDDEDIAFLDKGLDGFLDAVEASRLKRDLSIWKHWRKIVPNPDADERSPLDIRRFHKESWFDGSIFAGDPDHTQFVSLVPTAAFRLNIPVWDNIANNCTNCMQCLKSCPQSAIRRRGDASASVYSANSERCIGCGICAAVCPERVWKLLENI